MTSSQKDLKAAVSNHQHNMKLWDGFLPNEILMRIFQFLPFDDMQNVRLVCSQWLFVANAGRLNGDLALCLTPSNYCDVLYTLLNAPLTLKYRMRNLRVVGMQTTSLLTSILRKACSYIQTLNLINSPITWSINQQMPHLYELELEDISQSENFKDQFICSLEYFPSLKTLLLGENVASSWRSGLLQMIATPSTVKVCIEKLKFQFNYNEQSLALDALKEHASTIKFLDMNYFSNKKLHIAPWQLLFQQLTHIECFHLSGSYSSDWLQSVFEALPVSIPLKQLHLKGCIELGDSTLMFIMQKWPNTVQELNVMLCARITDRSICNLSHQSGIRVLNLSHVRSLTGQGLISSVFGSTSLRELYLSESMDMDKTYLCSLIQNLPHLEHLAVNSCAQAMTDYTMTKIFHNLIKLQRLEVDNCYRISDKGMQGLAGYSIERLQSLRVLSLWGCSRITDVTLIENLHLNKLQTLKLGYSRRITAKGIAALVQSCPSLEELIITSCPGMNDEAVWHIATKLKRLRLLNLSNCHSLTPKSIDYIAKHCDKLAQLIMAGTNLLSSYEVRNHLGNMKPRIKIL